MPRHDRAHGTWFQSGRKAGSVARKNRTSKGGRYAAKIGNTPSRKVRRAAA